MSINSVVTITKFTQSTEELRDLKWRLNGDQCVSNSMSERSANRISELLAKSIKGKIGKAPCHSDPKRFRVVIGDCKQVAEAMQKMFGGPKEEKKSGLETLTFAETFKKDMHELADQKEKIKHITDAMGCKKITSWTLKSGKLQQWVSNDLSGDWAKKYCTEINAATFPSQVVFDLVEPEKPRLVIHHLPNFMKTMEPVIKKKQEITEVLNRIKILYWKSKVIQSTPPEEKELLDQTQKQFKGFIHRNTSLEFSNGFYQLRNHKTSKKLSHEDVKYLSSIRPNLIQLTNSMP